MAYKPVNRCPVDNAKLPKGTMVQSTVDEVTYHCHSCDTYWHFAWVKHYPIGYTRYKWRLAYVRDDYGKRWDYVYPS